MTSSPNCMTQIWVLLFSHEIWEGNVVLHAFLFHFLLLSLFLRAIFSFTWDLNQYYALGSALVTLWLCCLEGGLALWLAHLLMRYQECIRVGALVTECASTGLHVWFSLAMFPVFFKSSCFEMKLMNVAVLARNDGIVWCPKFIPSSLLLSFALNGVAFGAFVA